jgi:hypothetical protein
MGKIVFKSGVVTANGVDISDHVSKVTIASKFDDVDFTSLGDNYKEHGQGLGDATITLECFQDFAAGELDSVLWPLSQSGATFPVLVRATSSARSATNPEFSMTCILLEYNPIDGQVGNALTTPVSLLNGSSTGLQRLTS